ncbi:MAG: hypothetical protein JXP34_20915 [Planctomycetes bacterium]|nr:hypothetical protein [Planctomycetota bacterium]
MSPFALPSLLIACAAAADSRPAEASSASSRIAPIDLGLDVGDEARSAVEDALRFLEVRQSADSGAIGSDYRVATTSLAGLAFLGAGNGYRRGRYGTAVERCVSAILIRARAGTGGGPLGYIGEGEGEGKASRMHGHGFAVLFLTQACGELPPAVQREAEQTIRGGIRVMERAVSSEGGWYYDPENAKDQDESSVTVCVLQALRAAHNIGFEVDPRVISRAEQYLHRCANPDGGFRYSISSGPSGMRSSFALTAAAVASLHAVGVYRSEDVRKGLEYLRKKWTSHADKPLEAAGLHRFYGNFYAAQAFFQVGGAAWESWYPAARRELLSDRSAAPDAGRGGRLRHWRSAEYGDEYATAIAALILEIPLRYLPIFQR